MKNYKQRYLDNQQSLIYEDVYELFWTQNLTKGQVKDKIGCSLGQLNRFIKENKLIKSQEMITQSQKNLLIERYGIDNPMKLQENKDKLAESMQFLFQEKGKEVIEKRKQTWIEKYGVDNPSKSEIIKKRKEETCLQNFGVKSPQKSEIVKNKIKQTCLERYGDNPLGKNSSLKDKIKETIKERYGYENPMQNAEIASKTSRTLKERQDEIIQDSRLKYGVDWPSQLQSTKDKINATKRKRGTFHASEPEETVYKRLSERFKDTIRQYNCERYPFACDFYIPSLDLFIEYKGFEGHGSCIFDKNNPEHLKKVRLWEQKAERCRKDGKESRYDAYLYTWTDLDVRKYEYVQKNQLNYKEFYTLEEFLKWFNSIKQN